MLAVLVTKEGLPIDYEEFPGNSYEGHTLLPVLHKIRKHYHVDNAVIVADAALMNKINLQELDRYGFKYIIAARLKNVKKEIKKTILDISNYKTISSVSNIEDALYDELKAKIIPCDTGDFIFAYHSTKRARKDAYDREKDLEKIKKYLNSTGKSKLAGSLKKSYVTISKNCQIKIDYEKLKLEARYDGLFGLRTNIENANPLDILDSYRGLWQVEQTFRIAKSNLEIRPVFHYNPRRIRAHLLICYMALSLVRHVEFTLKRNGLQVPCDQLYLLLDRMRKIQLIDAHEHLFEFLEDPPTELIPIYQALKIKWHKKFQHVPRL
jgi:transposase